MLSSVVALSFSPPVEEGIIRVPVTKAPRPRQMARENNLGAAPSVDITDYMDAQYYGSPPSPGAAHPCLPSMLI